MSQEYQDNIAGDFFMCNIVWKLSDNIAKGFCFCNVTSRVLFSSAFFSGVSRTTLHGVLAVQYCPRSVKAVLLRIFSCVMLFGTSRTTMHKIIFLWKFVEHQRQRYIGFFVQCCFRSVLRQHQMGFFRMQCCLEPLGQDCHGFLSVQSCPESNNTTLSSFVQYCLVLLRQHCTEFFMCKDVTGVSRQRCTELFPEQCSLNGDSQT